MVDNVDIEDDSGLVTKAHNALVERFAKGNEYNVTALDKQIVYVAAGTLGLSLSFVGDVVDLHSAILLPVLVASWILLLGAIVTNLAGFRFVTTLKYQEESLDIAKQMTGMPPYDGTGPNPEEGRKRVRKSEKRLELYNKWSYRFLVLGLFGMISFVSTNLLLQQSSVQTATCFSLDNGNQIKETGTD